MTAFSGSEEEDGEAEASTLVEQTSPHTDSGGSLDTRLVAVLGGVVCTAYCLHSCRCCGRLV